MSRLTKCWRRRVGLHGSPLAALCAPAPASAVAPSAYDVPPLWRDDFPVAVCWSAKAGCTTVLKWFLHHMGLLETAAAHHHWPHHYRVDVFMKPVENYVARCAAALHRGDTEVVKIIRDPVRRAVSSYIHFVRMSVDPGWKPGIEGWKREVGLGRQPGLSFEQFLYFVGEMRTGGRPLDIHFRPQWEPDWDGLVDRVIPLEHLAAGIADIESRHGLPRTDVRLFSESRHHNPPRAGHGWPRDVARFAATRDDLLRLGTPPVEDFLDDRTHDLVRAAYDVDFAAYASHYAEPRTAVRQAA